MWFDIAEERARPSSPAISGDDGEGVVVALVKDGSSRRPARATAKRSTILLNQTPFYGESGGQMGDTGTISDAQRLRRRVEDTSKPLGRLHAHPRRLIRTGQIAVGDTVHPAVDAERRDRIRANHSATHLLHAALRHRLGEHVTQKGTLVAPDHFRFDFSHPKPLTREDIAAVEAEVNAQIRDNEPVDTRLMSPDDAIAAGAMALFGEKYGDEVRVLSMGRGSDSGLFGRAVRRHPRPRARRHRAAQDHLAKARSPRACAGSRR